MSRTACKRNQERRKKYAVKKGVITPLAAMELSEINANRESFTVTGLEAIRDGKVGAVLLAGGMGTRLGSDNPKCMYNVGINRELYIFECLVNNMMDVVRQSGSWFHLFVMTSEKNNDVTIQFMKEKEFFGYNSEFVHFFKQEMAAATDYEGKIYLEEKGRLATSPNGNGGWFISMKNAGLLDLVKKEGIEWINVFAVDNVLQRIADPCFVGATIERNCDVGAKVVRKNAPDEKGNPAYNFGVILNYLFRVSALEQLLNGKLPLHIVEKKIPCLNENGELVKPQEPNGYKYENLVLDMIHQMDNCLPYEVERNREFAPIKNQTGIDSVESARALLQENGVEL